MRTRFAALGVLALLAWLLIPVTASSAGHGANEQTTNRGSEFVSALGVTQVDGQQVFVDVVVVVPAGADARSEVRAALAEHGARPIGEAHLGSAGFTVTGLVWDDTDLPVEQTYNPANEPVAGETLVKSTHATWDGVTTSDFDIDYGGISTVCPSLVRKCSGPQTLDGENTLGWVKLGGRTLGVTYFTTSDPEEADVALNTRFSWNEGCVDVPGSIDAETVILHENGHVVGLGHSDDPDAIMRTPYEEAQCTLGSDDAEGTTFLYDASITGEVTGTVEDSSNTPISGAEVVLEDTGLSATTDENGVYTITGVPDPVTYTATASAAGFDSDTIDRITVDASTLADFTLQASDGGDDGGGGGVCPPGNPNHPKCS